MVDPLAGRETPDSVVLPDLPERRETLEKTVLLVP